MDKKYIAISAGLIVFMIVTILVYNLVIKKKSNENNQSGDNTTTTTNTNIPKTTNGTITCKKNSGSYNQAIVLNAKNGKIESMEYKYSIPPANYQINSEDYQKRDSTITTYIEEKIKKEWEAESLSMTGITFNISYNENIDISILVDYTKASQTDLDNMGFSLEDMNVSTTVGRMMAKGVYTCQ